VKLIHIYGCLCDETRLRILHLLSHTPLCVCHFQSVLQEPQVKISKHLRYLKKHGLVESTQHQNWRIYKLPSEQSYELRRHLQCLQDCIQENKLFRQDLKRLKAITTEASAIVDACCGAQRKTARKQKLCC
jgi:ArsR family transcriptional regulator